ncbi:MAG: aldo/keto reductase [Acidobacteria bacterium]|nr:aldo/keto reductase [Acidobacteriota bacterium]
MAYTIRKDSLKHASIGSRRDFLKNVTLGGLSAPLALRSGIFNTAGQVERKQRDGMFYRRLGRTDMWISELSLGSSPLPDWTVFREIIERGVNYIDCSHTYSGGNSERQIGRLMKEVGRDRIHIGTKFHLRGDWDEPSIIQTVEGSLKRLQTDHLDVCLIHGASKAEDLTDERVQSAFTKLKNDGKYRYRGFSCHENQVEVVKAALECGFYDMITLGYNVFDISEVKEPVVYDDYMGQSGLRKLIRDAAADGIGIIAMKTLKQGGPQQNLDRYRTGTTSIQQAMLKWALENRDIAAVVTEMLNFEQMEENFAAVQAPLTEDERHTLYRSVVENAKDYCHMCGTCRKACPQDIPTTDILRFLAYDEVYGKHARARAEYAALPADKNAGSCTGCGACNPACPYGVRVQARLQLAHGLLA